MTPATARWRTLCLATFVVFLGLSAAVSVARLLPGDAAVREGILGWASPGLAAVARLVNYGGSWHAILPALLLLLALSPEARRRWWLWCAVLVVTVGIETGFKVLVGRPRPEDVSMGFPSGHATGVATFGVLLIYLVGKERIGEGRRQALRTLALVAMVLVGVARIILHAHWPSDVIGGWLLGAACASAGAWWDAAQDSARGISPAEPVRPPA